MTDEPGDEKEEDNVVADVGVVDVDEVVSKDGKGKPTF